MAASILLGGVLPLMLIGACVGAVILAKKYQVFQWRRNQLKMSRRYILNMQQQRYKVLEYVSAQDSSSSRSAGDRGL